MVHYTDNISAKLDAVISRMLPDKVFLLTDTNVAQNVKIRLTGGTSTRVVKAGEQSKSLQTACELWKWLADSGATRHSLLINLGGGMVTDLGGFVAATFKRGISFLNVPTTLLAVADAAIGGKTGINLMGLKNEVGVFASAVEVIIAPRLLESLPDSELRSGFAEVVKTALLASEEIYDSLLLPDALYDKEIMARVMRFAARTKERIVEQDPHEKGLRKILNFGHTAGHAYEEYAAAIGRNISHGESVAHGMLTALELSRDKLGFPAWRVEEYREKILERYYSPLPFGAEADEEIHRLMTHDKKNLGDGNINFVLIPSVGAYDEGSKS